MPLTITNQSGDGATATLLDVTLQLPDSGTAVQIIGRVQTVGAAPVVISGGPLAIPTAPAAGSVFYNIQVDSVTGVATVQQSPAADPAPISPTALVVFRQTLAPSSTDPALTPEATPDTW